MDQPDHTEHRMECTYEVPATPEQVWEAIATAEGISAWMVSTTLDPRVGGTVTFDLGSMQSSGVVTDYSAPHRFAYEEPWPISPDAPIPAGMAQWFEDHDISASDVQRTLPSVTPLATEFLVESAPGGSSVVRVVSSSYGTGADWENEFFAGMIDGWSAMLDALVAHLSTHGSKR